MKRLISLFLSFVIVLGTFVVAIPPIKVYATHTIPEVLTLEPEIKGTKVTMIGELTKNGGVDIIEYGFSWQVNGGNTQTKRYDPSIDEISKGEEIKHQITLNPGDYGYYYFYAKNSEGKSAVSGKNFSIDEEDIVDSQKPLIDPITATPTKSTEYGTTVKFFTQASDDTKLQKLELLVDGTVEETCIRKTVFEDDFGVAAAILISEIRTYALASGFNVISSPFIGNEKKIRHVIIPQLGLGFFTKDKFCSPAPEGAKYISLRRFYDSDGMRYSRAKLNFAKKASKELIEEAFSALRSAKEIHDELESIYIDAMDFGKVEEIRKSVQKRIWESDWWPEE